jgi:DNA-binding CsgD family transcriptional regulator
MSAGPKLANGPRGIPRITPIKRQAADLAAEGKSRHEIAWALKKSPETISKYLTDVEEAKASTAGLQAARVR